MASGGVCVCEGGGGVCLHFPVLVFVTVHGEVTVCIPPPPQDTSGDKGSIGLAVVSGRLHREPYQA